MKATRKHIIISTVLCALTLAVFLAIYGKLPESISVHFDSAGNANSFWPRDIVVFGVPAVCVLLNIIASFSIQKKYKKSFMFYIVPVVAFVVTGMMIYLGMK